VKKDKFNQWLLTSFLLVVPACSSAFQLYATGTGVEDCLYVPTPKKFTDDLQNLLVEKGVTVTVVNGGASKETNLEFLYRIFKQDINPEVKLVIYVSPGGGYHHPQWMQLDYIEKVLSYTQKRNIPTIIALPIRKLKSNSSFLQKTADLTKKYNAYDYGSYAKNIPDTSENWVYRDTILMTRQNLETAGNNAITGNYQKNKEFLTAQGCYLWAENMLPLILQVIKERNIQ
jgi:hypothetical protein